MKIVNIEDRFYIEKDVKVEDKLEKGVYLLHKNEHSSEHFLQKLNDFNLPEKIYGDEQKIVDRYLNTFSMSNKNMGVLLTGLKGNGKSLTAKLLSKTSDLPTILITECYKGVEFKQFLQDLKQEAIILIDEFEKIYTNEDNNQEEFLSILDGVFENKKLFIFTTNTLDINQFLKNRPNRIRYLREYDGLEKPIILEIIDDLLENKSKKKELIEVLNILSSVSMDVLLHLIQEMNYYEESARQAVKHLNIQVEHTTFDVRLYFNGKLYHSKVNYNPLTSKYI
ncbi:MAG: AAA family ATPase, partial [Romboutsia sp.]|nr:AAA family ATPase [Romboutsia sp.]